MFRFTTAAVVLGALAAASVAQADEMTTRTEAKADPCANYTVEKGVRIWRPRSAYSAMHCGNGDDRGAAVSSNFTPGPFHPGYESHSYSYYSNAPSSVWPGDTSSNGDSYGGSGLIYAPRVYSGFGYGHRGHAGVGAAHGVRVFGQFGPRGIRHPHAGHASGYGGGFVQPGHRPGHGPGLGVHHHSGGSVKVFGGGQGPHGQGGGGHAVRVGGHGGNHGGGVPTMRTGGHGAGHGGGGAVKVYGGGHGGMSGGHGKMTAGHGGGSRGKH
jgi:hypothetical protein